MSITKEALQKALALHRDWLAGKDGGKRANLSGSDLSGSDLSGSDLSGSDLSGSDLSGSNLSGSDLFCADLSGSDLSRATLSGSDLSGATLSGATLSRSDLSGANLSGSDLYAYAQVSFSGHGECGRMLTAIKQTEESEIYLCCGCFRGSEKDLKDFIANDEERYRKSRTLAMETVLKLLKEQRA